MSSVRKHHLRKVSGTLLVSVPADRTTTETVMKCNEGIGNTFNCDASCAARHAELVSCHTSVETGIRFGCIPYTKVTVAQNVDPVVKKKKNSIFNTAVAFACPISDKCCSVYIVKFELHGTGLT